MTVNDIATGVFPAQSGVAKNGYVVTSVLKTGAFQDKPPDAPGESVNAAGYAAEFANRLTASGSLPVVTR